MKIRISNTVEGKQIAYFYGRTFRAVDPLQFGLYLTWIDCLSYAGGSDTTPSLLSVIERDFAQVTEKETLECVKVFCAVNRYDLTIT